MVMMATASLKSPIAAEMMAATMSKIIMAPIN